MRVSILNFVGIPCTDSPLHVETYDDMDLPRALRLHLEILLVYAVVTSSHILLG